MAHTGWSPMSAPFGQTVVCGEGSMAGTLPLAFSWDAAMASGLVAADVDAHHRLGRGHGGRRGRRPDSLLTTSWAAPVLSACVAGIVDRRSSDGRSSGSRPWGRRGRRPDRCGLLHGRHSVVHPCRCQRRSRPRWRGSPPDSGHGGRRGRRPGPPLTWSWPPSGRPSLVAAVVDPHVAGRDLHGVATDEGRLGGGPDHRPRRSRKYKPARRPGELPGPKVPRIRFPQTFDREKRKPSRGHITKKCRRKFPRYRGKLVSSHE